MKIMIYGVQIGIELEISKKKCDFVRFHKFTFNLGGAGFFQTEK
jgi:hypothetical protein